MLQVNQTIPSDTMKKPYTFLLIAALVYGCSNLFSPNKSDDVGRCNEPKLQKVTQASGGQYEVYQYDKNCNITKHEFYGVNQFSGNAEMTYYTNYYYSQKILSLIEKYVKLNNEFIKTGAAKYEYDDRNRLKSVQWSGLSETDRRIWLDGKQDFYYDDNDRLIRVTASDGSYVLYEYDGNGNAWKWENHLFQNGEYHPPLVITHTFDTKKNPFYRHGESVGIRFLSRNNVIGWESISPETGKVVARGSIEYKYNSSDYPTEAIETIISPLTSDQPSTEILHSQYEYVQ